MNEVLTFAILGLGAGAAYALTALGVVVIYKGSGVINFAQGAVAMIAAFGYYEVQELGIARLPGALMVLAGCAIGGILIYAIVMRPLRTAPALAKVVAAIGLLVSLLGAAQVIWGDLLGLTIAPSLLPTEPVSIGEVSVGIDRLYVLGITLALTFILWAVFRFTLIGLATRATAESERGAALLGLSPDLIAGANWALGFVLAGLAGILLAPITSLDINGLTFIILPALAAALVGRFDMIIVTAIAGILIGVGQSELTRYWTLPGINEALPFIVAIVAMLTGGASLSARGRLTVGRPPFSPSARIRPFWLIAVPLAAILGLLVMSVQYQAALTFTMLVAVLALSLVVVTGYVGQISLAAMTFAGIGALLTSKLGTDLGIPFPLPILISAAAAIPLGIALGIPALRIRGMNLAVVTLGAAVTVNAMVFQNLDITGTNASPVPTPSLWGFSLNATNHQVRFGIFVLIVGIAIAVGVSNLRRGAWGRRMLAVRANERAAAAAGVGVAVVKLQAFALSAAIAALGGSVIAYQLGSASLTRFGPLQSLTLLTVVYIGSIASVSGAVVGGVIAAGGLFYVLLTQIPGVDEYYTLITGLTLISVVIGNPDGQAVLVQNKVRGFLDRNRSKGGPRDSPQPVAGAMDSSGV